MASAVDDKTFKFVDCGFPDKEIETLKGAFGFVFSVGISVRRQDARKQYGRAIRSEGSSSTDGEIKFMGRASELEI